MRCVAASLAALLGLNGNETRGAYDGLAGLRIGADIRPDIVRLDIGVLSLDGFETARCGRAAEWGKHTVLIASSGWGQDKEKCESLAAAFNHHLVEPIDISRLESLLEASGPVQ